MGLWVVGKILAALTPCPVFPLFLPPVVGPNNAAKPYNAVDTWGLRVPLPWWAACLGFFWVAKYGASL